MLTWSTQRSARRRGAREIPDGTGVDYAVTRSVCGAVAVLPERPRARTTADWAGKDAAHVHCAAKPWTLRRRCRRRAVRQPRHPSVCESRPERESAPDATTQLKFRETHKLTESILATIKAYLASQGLLLREGTVPDQEPQW